jgi:hypothetical protein
MRTSGYRSSIARKALSYLNSNRTIQPDTASQPHSTAQLLCAKALAFFACDFRNLPIQDGHPALSTLALPAANGSYLDAGAAGCVQEVGTRRGDNAAVDGLEIYKIKA